MNMTELQRQMRALSSAMCAVQESIEALCQPPAPMANERLAVPQYPARKYQYFPTDWPVVGGRENSLAAPRLFACDAFRDQYRPGEGREIYGAACSGLSRLARSLKMTAYKVSTCAEGRLDERMLECRRDQYGRTWFCDGQYLNETGWDDWFPSQLHTQAAPSVNSPVTATTRAIIVRLPDDLSSQEFDRLIDAEIRKAALDLWVMTPEGHRHCSFLGVDPSVALRMTPYPYGAHSRNSPARELCAFRIHHDPDRLVALAELIILRHLGLVP